MAEVVRSFDRIMTWAKAELPLLCESMRPPASAAEIAALEQLIGKRLPDDVRELYSLADGQTPFVFNQTPDYPGFFLAHPFNPIERVMRDWRVWVDVIRDHPDLHEFQSSFPPDAVKAVYYTTGWIPLSDDAGGNFMGVDLDPGPNGAFGQWIVFGRDEDEKLRVASSLGAFLEWMADELERGQYVIRRGKDAEEHGPWVWREGEYHFHDAVRKFLKDGGRIG